jgi:hypothetical protein
MQPCLFAAFLLISIGITSAYADDANRDWNQSEGWKSANQSAADFNAAQALWLVQNGHTGDTSVVTNCSVIAACQYGGTATNLNGVSVNTLNGSGNTVSTGINAQSNQTAVSATIPQSTIGTIDLSKLSN